MNTPVRNRGFIRLVEIVLFNIRWLLIPFYLGLVVVLLFYGLSYFNEIIIFIRSNHGASIDNVKLFAIDAIDIVMVANLIKMIITGSYNSFVSKDHGYVGDNISSGELKVKIATSIAVLSMVHVLRTFISTDFSWPLLEKQLLIFGAFVGAALILALIEYIHQRCTHD